jgi:hypothetical protein
MNERYEPALQSPAYTDLLAEVIGTPPNKLDLREVLSSDVTLRRLSRNAVADAVKRSMFFCGPRARISPPTYPVRRALPDASLYSRIIGVVNELYEDSAARYLSATGDNTQIKIFSIAHGPDGYVPDGGETIRDVISWISPQAHEAVLTGSLPIVEATTSMTRFIGAAQGLAGQGVERAHVGVSVDSRGNLAADGTDIGVILDYVTSDSDRLGTKIELALHCGSFSGIQKVFDRFPKQIDVVYPNANDIPDLRGLEAVANGNGCPHHHGHAIGIDEVAHFACTHKPGVVGLCCGFAIEKTAELNYVIQALQE